MSLVQSNELSHSGKLGSSRGSKIEDIARSGGAGSWEVFFSKVVVFWGGISENLLDGFTHTNA